MNIASWKPNQIFLLDGIGALISAFSLGVLLVHFQTYIGMPTNVLYCLASVATFFAVYSLTCYRFVGENWRPFLKTIALFNLTYCIVSAACLIYFYDQLTSLGVLYFVGEKIVVLLLVGFEWRMATKKSD